MNEYGGFLPLELPEGKGCFHADFDPVQTNTARTAITLALRDCGAKRVHVPHYICETVYQAIENAGADVCRYWIGEDCLPLEISVHKNDAVLFVNYFGMCDLAPLIRRYADCPILLDNTQAFFAPPVPTAYTIYSPRKFFGVSDGGILILPEKRREEKRREEKRREEKRREDAFTRCILGARFLSAQIHRMRDKRKLPLIQRE